TPANGFNAGQGGNTWRLTSGGLSSSRWGLRGVEDLGSSTKAVYVLESGFSIDNGVQSQG
ncbi:MAG TPA: porin, partial [Cupriavidus sp.]|nr:porin [Cupriavidus sp.]